MNMSKKNPISAQPDVLEEGNEKLTETMNNLEYYFEKYKNIILAILAITLISIGGWWGYTNFIKGPKETKAKDAIIYAQRYFEIDSLNAALKGDGLHLGFEAIAKQFSGTAGGNRAAFCAGVCNLKLGNYTAAIKYLEDFNTSDAILQARKFGCLGDAYAEQNKMDNAIENYTKASEATDNELVTPLYLFRAALANEKKGNKKEALELYKKLNTDYPSSQEGMAAELYIAKLEAQTL